MAASDSLRFELETDGDCFMVVRLDAYGNRHLIFAYDDEAEAHAHLRRLRRAQLPWEGEGSAGE